MIERYNLPEIRQIWSDENKFAVMMEVEILACEAMAELNLIPKEAAQEIREKAAFTVPRIREIERETKHDVIAFVSTLAENVGENGKYIHMGMTSSDVLDTALSVQLRQTGMLLEKKMLELDGVLRKKALTYKNTLCMGRTHGIHAEPTTFGIKLLGWYMENKRNIERMQMAIDSVSFGMISGAVGTFANIDPFIEEYVCKNLGLKPEPVSTQIIARDHHLFFMMTLAEIATSLERFATELRNLQRTEIGEVMENFSKGQKGSSAMPHKRNPIRSERICGLARVIRSNVIPAAENLVTWHERDLSHSSVERIIFPDSTGLLYYILDMFVKVVDDLVVDEKKMMENVEKTHGLVFSQRVLLALIDKGVVRDTAYPWVQRNALEAWDKGRSFKDLIVEDEDIRTYLSEIEIDAIFDYQYHTRQVDAIFTRCGL